MCVCVCVFRLFFEPIVAGTTRLRGKVGERGKGKNGRPATAALNAI